MAASGAWRRLPEDARKLFGVELSEHHLATLSGFLDLVESWSARMNLVGSASRDELVDRHLLDSLAPLSLLKGVKTIADFGSGAGFPGIPLAVLRPEVELHLVESRRKRCSFLRHVARTIQLPNVTVSESRGESWDPPGPIDAAIGRALAPTSLATLAARVLSARGLLIVMRKQGGAEPIDGFEQIRVERYRLQGGERHEVAAYSPVS